MLAVCVFVIVNLSISSDWRRFAAFKVRFVGHEKRLQWRAVAKLRRASVHHSGRPWTDR
jgi:hypothetical protein